MKGDPLGYLSLYLHIKLYCSVTGPQTPTTKVTTIALLGLRTGELIYVICEYLKERWNHILHMAEHVLICPH